MSLLRSVLNQWVGHRANAAVLFALPFLAGAGGSLSSILFFGCVLWNVPGLMLGRLSLPRQGWALTSGVILFAFFAARAVSVPLSAAPGTHPLDSFKLLAFLGFLPILAALAHAPIANALPLFLRGAAAGAICGAFQAVVQVYFLGFSRAEGLAGNSGPFSTLMAISGGLSALLAAWPGALNRNLALAGALSGMASVLLAGSKGLIPAIPVLFFIVAHFHVRLTQFRPTLKGMFAFAGALALCALLALPVLNWRLVQFRDDLANMNKGQFTRSIGSRLIMWEEGLSAFAEKPLFGHGYNLRSEAVREAVSRRTGAAPGTHLHNAFITDLVGNGLVGLVTHLAVMAVPFLLIRSVPPGRTSSAARHAAAMVVVVYVTTDLSGLTFGHDILDCWYVFFLCLLASLRINSPLSEKG